MIGVIVAYAYEFWQNYKGRQPEIISKKMFAYAKIWFIKGRSNRGRSLNSFDSFWIYRVLRPVLEPGLPSKYPNRNPVISEPFDTVKFMDLCKKQ